MKTEIYKSPAASITYNATHNCILQTVNNYLHSEELKNFQTALIKFCKGNSPGRIIADTTKLKVIKSDDMEWLSNEVLPALSECGIRYFAIVMPNNPFGEMAVKLFIEASSDITMQIFEDLPSAQQWIRSCA